MGNSQSQVFPELENDAPWVMVTYDPRENYKNFWYNKMFDVYSNNSVMISNKLPRQQPCPPSNPIEPIEYTIDSNVICSAVEQILFEDDMTVEELVNTLFQKCSQERANLQDADKVKILFYWLTAQNVKFSEYKLTVDFTTVNYQLQKLRDRKNSYAAFFALLCYYANIPCVIVRGHVKGGRYEVDKPLTSDLIREWNAVLINEEWQFVDAFWGRVYCDKEITREDWYLFPSPESLIYSHFPENKTWQLKEHPLTEEEFIQLPILKKRFFEIDMELLSHTKGKVTCSSGDLELKFLLNDKNTDTQKFRCVISRQNDEKKWEEESLPDDGLRLQQLDFIQKTMSSEDGMEEADLFYEDDNDGKSTRQALSVKVRFQNTGYHKIEIVGRSREDEDYDWVAIYHVKVDYVPNRYVPGRAAFFPVMPDIGFGPNPYLKKCDLKAVSHTNGEIKCFPPVDLELKFRLLPTAKTNNVKLRYKLVNYRNAEDDNVVQLETVRENDGFIPSEDGTLLLPVSIEAIGEYKLSIAAKDNETDKDFVIHYLIVGEENQLEIDEALVLEILKELDLAIQSENISVLHIALSSAKSKKAHNHRRVRPKYLEACALMKRLQKYKEVLKRISQITNNHIATIRSWTTTDPVVVSIMRAVFLLLGENENALKNWDDIRIVIKRYGPQSIRRKVTGINIKTLEPAVVRRAEEELKGFDMKYILKKAEDVAAFALWIDFIFKSYKHDRDLQAGHSAESYV